MRRVAIAALVILLLSGTVYVVRLWAAPGPIYSVRQLVHELRQYPRTLLGRTVFVRALGMTFSWGTGHGWVAGRQVFLLEATRGVALPFYSRAYGMRTFQLNGAGVTAALLITGTALRPSPAQSLALWLAQVPVIGRLFGACPDCSADVYRIRLVALGPCPRVFSGFCPLGTMTT